MRQPLPGEVPPSGAQSQAHLAFDAHPLGHQRHARPGVGHAVDDHQAVETHTHPAINAPGRSAGGPARPRPSSAISTAATVSPAKARTG